MEKYVRNRLATRWYILFDSSNARGDENNWFDNTSHEMKLYRFGRWSKCMWGVGRPGMCSRPSATIFTYSEFAFLSCVSSDER